MILFKRIRLAEGSFYVNDKYIGGNPNIEQYRLLSTTCYEVQRNVNVIPVQNGIILPLKKGRGGVIDENDHFIEESFHDGEYLKFGGYYEHDEAEYIDETVIFGGYFIKQWGHFLMDSLNRLWAVDDYKECKIIVLNNNNDEIDGNYERIYELLGISSSRIVCPTRPLKYKKIVIPMECSFSNRTYTTKYKELIDKIVLHAAKDFAIHKCVYLTRTHFSDAQSKEIGEERIEKEFALNGFEIIAPETLRVDDQIALFQKAEVVVCVNGTIPFNVIFAKRDLKLIVLNKTSRIHDNLFEMCSVAGIEPTYVDVYKEPFSDYPKNLGDGPFWLCISKDLQIFFSDNNMMIAKSPKKATLHEYRRYLFLYVKRKGKDTIKKIIKRLI
ncbi:MAG TPA: hypothetical protein DIW07_07540 [Lachnospiraceae bacterium]|nr:hypothetical protein [Lachnospiraceae bacterium]HCR83253.1 hypothetical protein [Lachnospiraceae bacterium]